MTELHHPPEPTASETDTTTSKTSPWTRAVVLVLVGATGVLVVWLFGDQLSLASLAAREQQLVQWRDQSPVTAYASAFATYVLVTALSLPGAAVLTLVLGWFFGFGTGLILVSFASTLGATLAFLISRYVLGDWVQQRFADRLETANRELDRDGAFYLFTLRLIPLFPFFVVNLVMGLTRMNVWTFAWVSQIGMLAGTAVYVYAGSTVPSLQTLADEGVAAAFEPRRLFQISIAFALIGAFPLLARKLFAKNAT